MLRHRDPLKIDELVSLLALAAGNFADRQAQSGFFVVSQLAQAVVKSFLVVVDFDATAGLADMTDVQGARSQPTTVL